MNGLSRGIQEWLGAAPKNKGGLAQDILTQRFNPTGEDVGRAAYSTLVKGEPVSGQNIADDRMQNVLDQLSSIQKMSGDGVGGATGELAQAVMNESASMGKPISFTDALYKVQTGFRQGLSLDENGAIIPMTGYPQAKGAIKYGESAGTKQAEFEYAPLIRGAERQVEANTAADIERQKQIGQITGEQEGGLVKRGIAAGNTLELLNMAEQYLPYASSGGIDASISGAKSFFGHSDTKTQADAQLDLLASSLTASVPRFEGPQGVLDVQLYQKAAADVGNKNKPIPDRLAAVQTMKLLQGKYANQSDSPGMRLPGGNQNTEFDADIFNYMTPEEKALFE